ncbi:MAG: LLM class flavin-dependent oxidoreductase [Deltaproteobacteria bacterium]|nr:LLM class flavin-dependent oxidoreductase [Deltaproteobacteria bacterium]
MIETPLSAAEAIGSKENSAPGGKPGGAIELFSTCPGSDGVPRERYLESVIDVARWSEEAGCKGILVYTDNSLLDPWIISQIIMQNTRALCPLVAIQPIYMHPYTVAKMITSFGYLYGRRMYLNMVAGGFKNDLIALNDTTPHDKRYERLIEYTQIIQKLLEGGSAVDYAGEFYKTEKLKLAPPLPRELFPGIFVSGSSDAGLAAAKVMGATAVKYPRPPSEEEPQSDHGIRCGIRVGIIAREEEDEAWKIARARFPEDRKGQLTHQMAMKVTDSVWHKQLSESGQRADGPYWLVPFEHYKTMCPYLVGSYERVAGELARYIRLGYATFILDIPPSPAELCHTNIAFQKALEEARWQDYCKTT